MNPLHEDTTEPQRYTMPTFERGERGYFSHRCKQAGLWEEFSEFKNARKREYQAKGLGLKASRLKAWEDALEKYAPLVEEAVTAKQLGEKKRTPMMHNHNPKRDAIWVLHHLRDMALKEEDAPTPGCWNLLQWARNNEDKFWQHYRQVVGRQPRKSAADAKRKAKTDEGDAEDKLRIEDMQQMLREVRGQA